MLCQLRGKIAEITPDKDALRAVVDVQGIGYEVFMPKSSESRLSVGEAMTVFVCESVTAFDGAVTLYGFASREEKDFFQKIREHVDGIGPKKALEVLDRISKSLPDFKKAVEMENEGALVSIFGFTKKMAEKLIQALKDKLGGWNVAGPVKWAAAVGGLESEALSGLVNIGYREDEARDLIVRAKAKLGDNAKTETILAEALRAAGSRT